MQLIVIASLLSLAAATSGCDRLSRLTGKEEARLGGECPLAPGKEIDVAYSLTADGGPAATVNRHHTVPKDVRVNHGAKGDSYSVKLEPFPAAFSSGIRVDFMPTLHVEAYESASCNATLAADFGNRGTVSAAGLPLLPPFTS